MNLGELPRDAQGRAGGLALPPRGVLLFFCDDENIPLGGPDDEDAFRCVYLPGDPSAMLLAEIPEELRRKDERGNVWGTADVVALECRPELALPAPFPDELHDLDLTDAEGKAYWDLSTAWEQRAADLPEEAAGREAPVHRVGGVPHEIQGSMQAECELARRDDDPHAPPYSRLEAAEAEARRSWRLLAQLDSDYASGTMWGDAGMLYFWIRDEDLVAGRFDHAWCVMQCY